MGLHALGFAGGLVIPGLMTIMGGIFGFIGGAIIAIIYTVVPGATGGLEMKMDVKEKTEFFFQHASDYEEGSPPQGRSAARRGRSVFMRNHSYGPLPSEGSTRPPSDSEQSEEGVESSRDNIKQLSLM